MCLSTHGLGMCSSSDTHTDPDTLRPQWNIESHVPDSHNHNIRQTSYISSIQIVAFYSYSMRVTVFLRHPFVILSQPLAAGSTLEREN